jgi:hypothetical protein
MHKNAYIIDIESFVFPFHPSPQSLTAQERKAIDNRHIVEATTKILDFLRERNIKLTFAVVSEIYEWFPELIERIANEGHEIGHHGHHHRMIYNIEILEQELTQSKTFLEHFKPKLFQAPTIYFPKEGFRLLQEAGFQYSNTVYQGMPYLIDGIVEMPVSTFRPINPTNRQYPGHMTLPLVLTNCPFGSGLFTALLPKKFLHACYQKYQKLDLPTVTFIHDWQVVNMSGKKYPTALRKLTSPGHIPYMWNIWEKFCYLIDTIPFTTMESIYHDVKNTLTEEKA